MSYYLKRYWKINALAAFLLVILMGISAVLSLTNIQFYQSVFDGDFKRFIFWLIVLFVLWAVYLVLGSLQTLVQGRAVRAMNNQVRRDLTATLLQKDHESFHKQDSGEYLSWYTNNVNQIENLAWGPFFDGVRYVFQILWGIIALTTLHWSILVVALLTAIVMGAAPKLFAKRLERLGEACAAAQASATGKLKDLLTGYDVLRFFGRGDRFMRESSGASDQIEKAGYRRKYTQGFIECGLTLVNVFCQVIVNAFIGALSIGGVIIQAALAGGGNLCGDVYNGLNNLASVRLSLSASKPYFDKITVHDDGSMPAAEKEMPPVAGAITVEDLSFRYDKKPILQNRTMRFEIGKKYALTGPSGCGKSTLLKLLLGWLPDYTGTIRFDGQDARDYTPEQLQEQMSYIAQDVFLFNTTIRDNITLGEEFTEDQMQKALRDSALEGDLLHMPDGLDTAVGEGGSCLSGGQRQRVAIARALIHNRSILLVDEGTSALDQKNADIVEKSLLSNPDLTLILVSHHLTPERKAQFDQVFELEPVTAEAVAAE